MGISFVSKGAFGGLSDAPDELPLSKRIGRPNSWAFFLLIKKIVTFKNIWYIHMLQKSKHCEKVGIKNLHSHSPVVSTLLRPQPGPH